MSCLQRRIPRKRLLSTDETNLRENGNCAQKRTCTRPLLEDIGSLRRASRVSKRQTPKIVKDTKSAPEARKGKQRKRIAVLVRNECLRGHVTKNQRKAKRADRSSRGHISDSEQPSLQRGQSLQSQLCKSEVPWTDDCVKCLNVGKKTAMVSASRRKQRVSHPVASGAMTSSYTQTNPSCKLVQSIQRAGKLKMHTHAKCTLPAIEAAAEAIEISETSEMGKEVEHRRDDMQLPKRRRPETLNRKTLEKLIVCSDTLHNMSEQEAGSSYIGNKPEKKRGRPSVSRNRKTLAKQAVNYDTLPTVSGQEAVSSSIGNKPEKKKRGRRPGVLNRKTLEKLGVLSTTLPTVSGQEADSSSIGNKPEKKRRGRRPGVLNRKTLEKLGVLSNTLPTVPGQEAGSSSSIGNKSEKKKRGRPLGVLNRKTLEKLRVLSATLPTLSGQETGSSSSIRNKPEKKSERPPGTEYRKAQEKLGVLSPTLPTVSGQNAGSARFGKQPEKKTRVKKPGTVNSKSIEKCKVMKSVSDTVLTRARKQQWGACLSDRSKEPEKSKTSRKSVRVPRKTWCKCEMLERTNEQYAADDELPTGMNEQEQVQDCSNDSEAPEEKRGRTRRSNTRTAMKMRAVCKTGTRSICPYPCVTHREIPNAGHTQVRMSVFAPISTVKDKQMSTKRKKKQNGMKTCSSKACYSLGLPNPVVTLLNCDSAPKRQTSAKEISNLEQLVSLGNTAATQNTKVSALRNKGLEISANQKRQNQSKRLIRGKIDSEKRPRKRTLHCSVTDSSVSSSNKSENATAEENKELQCNVQRAGNEESLCNSVLQEELNNNTSMSVDKSLQPNTFEGHVSSFCGNWRTTSYLVSEEEYSDDSLSVRLSPFASMSPHLTPYSQLPEIRTRSISCQRVVPFTGQNVWKCSCARTSIWTFSHKRPNENKNTNIEADEQSLHWKAENNNENLCKKRKLDLLEGLSPLDFNPSVPDLEGFISSSCSDLIDDVPLNRREANEKISEPSLYESKKSVEIKKDDQNNYIAFTPSKMFTVPKQSQIIKIKPPSFRLPLTYGVEKQMDFNCSSLLNVKETSDMSYQSSPPVLDFFGKILQSQTHSSPLFCPISTDNISDSEFDIRDQTDTIYLSVNDSTYHPENGASSTSNFDGLFLSKEFALQCADANDSYSELQPSPENKLALNDASPYALNGGTLDALNNTALVAPGDVTLNALNDSIPCALGDSAPAALGDSAPAALGDSAPAALGDSAPAALGDSAPAALGDSAPAALGDSAPAALGDSAPAALGDSAPAALGDSAPAALGDSAPAALGVSAPAALGVSAPAALGVSAPAALGVSAPAALGVSVPAALGVSVPAALGDSVPAALGDSAPAALGDSAPAALGDSAPAALGVSAPAALGVSAPAALGVSAPAALGVSAPAALGVSAPAALGVSAPAALGVSAPAALGGSSPKALGGSSPKALGGSSPKALGGSSPKALGGSSPKALGDSAPAALGDSAPAALGDSAPAALGDSAPAALGDSAPAALGDSAPAALGDSAPAALGDSAPAALGDSAPAALGVSAPAALGVSAPAALGVSAPAALGVSAPAALGVSAPAALGVSASAALGDSAPAALGDSAPAALGDSAPAALGDSAPAALGDSAPAALGGSAPAALGGSAPAALGGSAPKALGGSAPKALGGSSPKALGGSSPKALADPAPKSLADPAPKSLADPAPHGLGNSTNVTYEDDVLVIDVIPNDPDLFGCFSEERKSPEFCSLIEKKSTADLKPKNLPLMPDIQQEAVSPEPDRSDSPMEIGTPVLDVQNQNVSGNKQDWTHALNLLSDDPNRPEHLTEWVDHDHSELPNQDSSEWINLAEKFGGDERSPPSQEFLPNNRIHRPPHPYICLQTESSLNENCHPCMHDFHGKEVTLPGLMNPDRENWRYENKLNCKPLQQIRLPYGYCKYFFNSPNGCYRAQCSYLHIPKQNDEQLCMDLMRKMINENRTSFLQRAFLVFIEYFSKYPPRKDYDEGVFSALLDQLLKLSWLQEVLHLLNTATSANILPSVENLIQVFEHVASSRVQVAVPSLMGIFNKCLNAGMTPTLLEINHIIATVNQLPDPRVPINFLLSVKSKIEAHLPKKSWVHELEAAMSEIEDCKVNSDWVKLGALYVSTCTGCENLTDLKNFSQCIAEVLMKESIDDRPDVPYCEFVNTIFKHPQLNDVHKTIVGRIGISAMFFYYKKELWQKGRRVLFKFNELKINYRALKGIAGQEVFASQCAVVNVAVEIFLMCGKLNSAVQTLRECDWIIQSAMWPCDQMDVLKRHSLLCSIVQEALRTSMFSMCFEVLQNLPGFKESQAEFNVSQYNVIFNKVLNSAVSNQSLGISSSIVDFMVLKKIPIDYINLRDLITALGHSGLWHKARDQYKCALSLGFYPLLDGDTNNTILYIPSFMSAIEMLLTIERFMVSKSSTIRLPGGCFQNLQIILRKIFKDEDSSKGKDSYHVASERLLEAARLSSPRLFIKHLTVNNSGEQVYILDHNCCVKWLSENVNWAVKIWGFH